MDAPSTKLFLAEDIPHYRCPGESQPISEAVHLGRLASGYAACEQCVWRFENASENCAVASTAQDSVCREHPVSRAATGFSQASFAIRRTRFGIRGRYLNAMDRSIAAALTPVIISSLSKAIGSDQVGLAIGYENASGAPDIFAGVQSAAVRSSDVVVNAGCCSAASLAHCIRGHSDVRFGLLVSAVGAESGEIGIDFVLDDGRPVSIPWAEYGIVIQTTEAGDSVLKLPEEMNRFAPRRQRSSGRMVNFPAESEYQRWVSSWWTGSHRVVDAPGAVTLCVPETTSEQRMNWLRMLTPRVVVGNGSDRRHGETIVKLDADDRFASVRTPKGRDLTAQELMSWINSAERRTVKHVTAHVTSDGDRVYLCDIASPLSSDSQQTICDGLVLGGFLENLLQHNRLP